jgi:hypothetical protein
MAATRFASLRNRLVALIVLAALPTLGLAIYTHAGERREAARKGREAALGFARGLAAPTSSVWRRCGGSS